MSFHSALLELFREQEKHAFVFHSDLELGIFDLAGDCISQLTTHQSLDHSKVKIARDNNASSLSVKSDNIRITTAALTSQRLVRSISIDLEALTLNSSAALITIGLLLPPHQTIQAFEQGKPSCTLSTSAHPTQSDYVVLMDFPLALGVSAKSTNAQMIATLMKRVDQNEIGESWMLKFPGDYLVTEVVNLTNLANLMQRDYEACIPLVRAQNFAGCLSIARLLNQRRKSVERRKDVDAIVNMEWMSNPQPAITRSGGAEEEKLGPKQGLPTSGEGAEGQADDVYVDLPFDRISYILENLTRRQDALDANILDLSHLCSAIKTEVEIYAKENDLLNKVCDKVATFETLLLDLYTHLGKTSQQAKEVSLILLFTTQNTTFPVTHSLQAGTTVTCSIWISMDSA